MNDSGAPSALSPFKYPVFRGIWTASLLSNFGSLIQSVGASWMMLSIAPSPDMVALVQASTALPIMLFSLVGGPSAIVFVVLAAVFVALALRSADPGGSTGPDGSAGSGGSGDATPDLVATTAAS